MMAPKNCILWEIFWTTLSKLFFDKFIKGMEEFVFCGKKSFLDKFDGMYGGNCVLWEESISRPASLF